MLLATFSDALAAALRARLRRLIGNEAKTAERRKVRSMSDIGRRLYAANVGRLNLAAEEDIRNCSGRRQPSGADRQRGVQSARRGPLQREVHLVIVLEQQPKPIMLAARAGGRSPRGRGAPRRPVGLIAEDPSTPSHAPIGGRPASFERVERRRLQPVAQHGLLPPRELLHRRNQPQYEAVRRLHRRTRPARAGCAVGRRCAHRGRVVLARAAG